MAYRKQAFPAGYASNVPAQVATRRQNSKAQPGRKPAFSVSHRLIARKAAKPPNGYEPLRILFCAKPIPLRTLYTGDTSFAAPHRFSSNLTDPFVCSNKPKITAQQRPEVRTKYQVCGAGPYLGLPSSKAKKPTFAEVFAKTNPHFYLGTLVVKGAVKSLPTVFRKLTSCLET